MVRCTPSTAGDEIPVAQLSFQASTPLTQTLRAPLHDQMPRRVAAWISFCLLALVAAALTPGALAQSEDAPQRESNHFEALPHTWSSAGNGATNDHYAPYEYVLNPRTVKNLSPRWIFTANGEVQGTPTVEHDGVFASDSGGAVWRLNAQTGKVVWQTKLPAITGISGSFSRVSPAVDKDTVVIGDQASATLIALSRATGALLWKTTVATNADAFITSSPLLFDGHIYVGVSSNQEYAATVQPGFQIDFRGSVVALNESDGKLIWQTYTVPSGYTGGAVWSSNLSADPVRQAVYVDTGNNYSVPSAVSVCQLKAKTNKQQEACLDPNDHIDSVLSLDMNSGAVKWAQRFTFQDTAIDSCVNVFPNPATPCPVPHGQDTDFGSAPNLFAARIKGASQDLIGAGQKSGVYWAMNRDTGQVVWATQVGAGGRYGGIEYGTATDGQRIYIPEGNANYVATTLVSGIQTNGGYWSALDPGTGKILWQNPTLALAVDDSEFVGTSLAPPLGAFADTYGSVSVANGVMYGEDQAGNFLAINAATGETLFTFPSGGTSISAPAIVDGMLYWSSGYKLLGATNNKIYAFGIDRRDSN